MSRNSHPRSQMKRDLFYMINEINGLYTYKRKVCKVEKDLMRKVSKKLYEEIES